MPEKFLHEKQEGETSGSTGSGQGGGGGLEGQFEIR